MMDGEVTGHTMLLAALIVSGIGIILLAHRAVRYERERDSWRTSAMLWREAAERWEESYRIVSDGFDALWRMHNKSERENHE